MLLLSDQLLEAVRRSGLTERSFNIPVYSSLVYLSRSKHRGVNADCDVVQDIIQGVKEGDSCPVRHRTFYV